MGNQLPDLAFGTICHIHPPPGDEPRMVTTTQRLLAEILHRYGSLEAFCARLRADHADPPTLELPGPAGAPSGGRHRAPDSD